MTDVWYESFRHCELRRAVFRGNVVSGVCFVCDAQTCVEVAKKRALVNCGWEQVSRVGLARLWGTCFFFVLAFGRSFRLRGAFEHHKELGRHFQVFNFVVSGSFVDRDTACFLRRHTCVHQSTRLVVVPHVHVIKNTKKKKKTLATFISREGPGCLALSHSSLRGKTC